MSSIQAEAIHSPLRIAWLSSPTAMESVAEDWKALEGRVRNRTVFATFDFLATWYNHYAGDYGGAVLIGLAWRGSQLVGVAPLTVRRGSIARIPVTRVDFAPNDSPTGAFLVEDDHPEIVDALFTSLVQSTKFDVACLNGFDDHSSRLTVLQRAAERHRFRLEMEDESYALADLHDGYEQYRAVSLSGSYRRKFNQKERRINAAGGTIEGVLLNSGVEKMDVSIARMIDITERSYKLHGRRLADDHRSYLSELGKRFGPRGMLSLTILSIGGVDAAYLFGLVERGCFYDINLAYAETFEKLSPGAHLMLKTLDQLSAAGVHTVISHVAHEYKKHWATKFVHQKRVFLFSPNIRSGAIRFIRFACRPWLGRFAGSHET